MAQIEQQRKMRRAEFAALAGISMDTAQRWARAGIGPKAVQIGPRVAVYDVAEVEAWLAGRE